jgi:hypothetical protein
LFCYVERIHESSITKEDPNRGKIKVRIREAVVNMVEVKETIKRSNSSN